MKYSIMKGRRPASVDSHRNVATMKRRMPGLFSIVESQMSLEFR